MPASNVPRDVKAAALADLMAGEQPAVVAERYGLPRNTVKSWRARLPAGTGASTGASLAPDASAPRPLIRPTVEAQQREIGAIILDLLAAKLEASAALARTVSDPAWLARQSAAELAQLGAYLDGTALAIGDRLAGSADLAPPDRDALG